MCQKSILHIYKKFRYWNFQGVKKKIFSHLYFPCLGYMKTWMGGAGNCLALLPAQLAVIIFAALQTTKKEESEISSGYPSEF